MSAILDLANGLENDKSLLTGLFAFELGRSAALGENEVRAAFLAGLLRHLGCTAYASGEALFADDDIGFRKKLVLSDSSNSTGVVRATYAAGRGFGDRLLGVARLLANARNIRSEWMRESCGAARLLAAELKLGPVVALALDEVFERWDGKGGPNAKGGLDVSPVGRAATTAHVAVGFWLHHGIEPAKEVLAQRAGGALDPQMAARAAMLLDGFAAAGVDACLPEVERALSADPLSIDISTIARTFGDFADLQTPFTHGHSRRVAEAARSAGAALELPPAELATLVLAAHLHDLGQVAIPTGLWMRPAWTDADRERARLHPLFTERVLSGAPPLAAAARVAAAHHELLDGSGYHQKEIASRLPRAARILAASEVFCGLREDRPHRPAASPAEARRALEGEVRAGKLDAECVAALTGTSERGGAARAPVLGLTAREQDVLRLLAHGKTNKEIAAGLGISDRTVQHHTIHIYEKLSVDTRAGAALVAARLGIV